VKKLLKRKVNVNAADMHGVTPALALCYGVNREIEDLHHYQLNSYRVKGEVEVLIQKTKERVIASFREIFGLLVKRNADFTIKDKVRIELHLNGMGDTNFL
jgi:hypothetical protein